MDGLPQPARFSVPRSALFLDFDGTLIDFGPTPDAVTVPATLRTLLHELHRAGGGALALVSGRRIEALDALLAPLRLPAAGLHGLERRDGRGAVRREHPPARAALERVAARLREYARDDTRLLVEDKQATVALHFRAAPERAPDIECLAARLSADLPDELTLQRGHMVLEIRPRGTDKGGAIAAYLAEAPFAGRHPVFVGDDATDEHGFVAVNARGGISVKVGTGPTAARARLADPAAVHAWLSASLHAPVGNPS